MASSVLGVDGLISGLDTTSLINQLMQIEAAPQTLLKSKQSDTTKLVSALQALNAKVASLAEAATKAAKPASWQALAASSSATSVAATATVAAGGAWPTQLTFTVDRLAAVQVSVTPTFTSPAELAGALDPPKIVLRGADGTAHEVSLDGATSAADVAHLINASDAGVSAVAVKVGADSYRLQLTSAQSGTAGAFTLEDGDGAAVALTTVTAAEDAQITLWPGAGAGVEVAFTSPTNTFAGVASGVSFTVSALEPNPVTVSLSRDDGALEALASGLVANLTLVLSEIDSQTKTTTTTSDDGRSVVAGGVLSGTSAVRNLRSAVSQAASYGVAYGAGLVSPSSVGISIDRYGAMSFDAEVFASALAADPEKVRAVVSAVAERVAEVATAASDKYDGTLTLTVTSQQDAIRTLGLQIDDWDRRLEMRRATLQSTYAALETSLSNLRAQSSWLESQLGSLASASSQS
jgi:flagellar hook-associated protein 2